MSQNALSTNFSVEAQQSKIKRATKWLIVMFVIFAVWIYAAANFNQAQASTLSSPSLSCYAKTYYSITLKWTQISGAQSYVIYQYNYTEGKYYRLKVVSGGASTKYTVPGLDQNKGYKFVIRPAKTTAGSDVGNPSNPLSVTTYPYKTCRITPDMLPINKAMLNYGYYTKYTRPYYLVRSYMELFEKYGGGKLILSAGTYTITNTIFVPSNVTLVFEDGAYMCRGTYTGCELPASHSLFQLVRPSRGHSVGVYSGYNGEKNITFLGYGNATIDMKSQYNSNCIQTGHNQNLTIEGLTFRNVSGGHFIEMDATKNTVVKNCKFYNITGDNVCEAINLDTPDKITKGYTAIWSTYDCTANYKVLITNCYFSSMGRGIGTHNYSGSHTHDYVTITNNTMNNMRSYSVGLMNWRYAVVSNNKMVGNSTAIADERSGVLGYGIKNCTIKNNTITSYYRGMLYKTGVGGNEAEMNAYGPIYNYFTEQNITDLVTTNYCNANVADKRALIFYKDGTVLRLALPTM